MKNLVFLMAFFYLPVTIDSSSRSLNAQGNPGVSNEPKPECCTKTVDCVGILTERILAEASKFNPDDIIYSNEIKNKKPYSPVFVINEKYFYRLDIVEPKLAREFVKEFLVVSKIEGISACETSAGEDVIWGDFPPKGTVFITLKADAKFNPYVAGLKKQGTASEANYNIPDKGYTIRGNY